MKELVKGFIKWVIIIIVTLNIVVWTAALVRCQHSHDDQADLEDNIRIKSISFLSVDGNKVYFKRETRYRVDLGSFEFDSDTVWNRDKPPPKCMVAIYCITHDYLYAFYPCKK